MKKLNSIYRIDVFKPAASQEVLEQLKKEFPNLVPEIYVELCSEMTEVEMLVKNEDYIRIWGPTGCLEMNEAYHIQKYIPNSLAIGDDEGGSALIMMTGEQGFGIYKVGFGCLDIEEAEFISDSLENLLINGDGADKLII